MFDYQMFAEDTGTNLNTTATMPDEIKTYYDDYLIDCSLPKLVHDQFRPKAPHPGRARQDHRVPQGQPAAGLDHAADRGRNPRKARS